MDYSECGGEAGPCLSMHTALSSAIPSHAHLVLLSAQRSSSTITNWVKIMPGEALVPSCVFQVPKDPVVDSLASDIFQAAYLLCELSESGRM